MFRDLVPFTRRSSERNEESPFLSLQREINRTFDDFFNGFALEPFSSNEGFVPAVDVKETDKEIQIQAELPGLDEKDVEVTVNKDFVSIRGEKKAEKEDKDEKKGYYRVERSYGSFSRTIPLPAEVDEDKAEAKYKKGVLKITLPKTEKAQKESKKIAVQAE